MSAKAPGGLRCGYAMNQWKPNFDDFTRPEQHRRAFKVIAACGFTGIELRAGTGRWDSLGRPASIAANYGSARAFAALLADHGIEAVSSWMFDPGDPIDEELSRGRSILDADAHEAIAATCRELAEFLQATGGSRLVVRALPAAWRTGALTNDQLAIAAAGWTEVGRVMAPYGVRVSLHADALSAAADDAVMARLLEASDPEVVGLTIDTGELVLASLDPAAWISRFGARVNHVQLKDTRFVDVEGERLAEHAERGFLQEGGRREIDRWFFECGTPGGLVDLPGVIEALQHQSYDGWLVFESDPSPNPAQSAMLNGWYAGHALKVLP